jgi:hypothetical protein
VAGHVAPRNSAAGSGRTPSSPRPGARPPAAGRTRRRRAGPRCRSAARSRSAAAATSTRTASPAACPNRSLTGLKPSRSTKSSDIGCPACARHLQGVLDPVHEQAAVGQVGEQVVPREVRHVLGEPQPREGVEAPRPVRRVPAGRRRGGPGPVPPGRHDPPVLCPAAARRSRGRREAQCPELDLVDPEQPRASSTQGVDDLPGLGEGLRLTAASKSTPRRRAFSAPAFTARVATSRVTSGTASSRSVHQSGSRAHEHRAEVAEGVEGTKQAIAIAVPRCRRCPSSGVADSSATDTAETTKSVAK